VSGATRRAWLVARREWSTRVRSVAFRISTLVSLLIVLAIIIVPAIVGGGSRPTRTVGVVGPNPPQLAVVLGAAGRQAGLTVKTEAFADAAAGRAALRSGDVAVLLIDQRELLWKAETDPEVEVVVTSAVQTLDRERAIAQLGLTPEQARRLLQPPNLTSRSLEPSTKERTARIALATIGLVLLFMAISIYGGFLLVGVIEEKSSRVVEVLLSRLRPTELLVGKTAGIGLVGLAQFVLIGAAALVALSLTKTNLAPRTTPATIAWTVFWFILGYGFYSVLFAAAGSLVSRQEDAQSMTFPITALLLVGYLLAFATLRSPDSAAAVIGSLVPFTAPMVMTVRIASGAVPWWQIALSVTLMVASIVAMVQLAARVYAGALLRIGQRVKVRDAWRAGGA
jgi:ABC-2 type transport system permease protein